MRINVKRKPEASLTEESPLVRLPAAPITASPVPGLTSLHAREGRGDYGDPNYRGNCSGLLIEDLLKFYRPRNVLDPMSGGGTCGDVCRTLGIECHSTDLQEGFDATESASFKPLPEFDFVWLHPPYFRMISYNSDPKCLSQSADFPHFLERLQQVLRNCMDVLAAGGIIAILMGDGKEDGIYMGLPFRTLQAADRVGLWLTAPEIIRFGHGSTSSKKVYSTSFIPRVHDVCLVLRRKVDLLETNGGRKGLDFLYTPWHPLARVRFFKQLSRCRRQLNTDYKL